MVTGKLISRMFTILLIAVFLLTGVLPVQATASAYALSNLPGTLDTTFDNDGQVTTDFGRSDDIGQAVAIQPDGKILVAGLSASDTGSFFALSRYDDDGSLDLTFGTNGKVVTSAGDGASASAVALQSDGKIVVVGSSIFAGFVLVRYNYNGSLDTSFGTNGVATTNFDVTIPYYDYAHSIAVQSDGKIVVAGASYYDGNYSDFALARYNNDGSLDTTFDTDGKVTTDFGGSDDGYSIAIQLDGKIVLTGGSQNGNSYGYFALARYNTDGSLDTNFDGDGKVISDLGSSVLGSVVALQIDGKIVMAGNTAGVNRNFVLARYNSNGSLDTTFDGDGQVTTDFGNTNDDDARAIVIQLNGKIIVAGSSRQAYGSDFALARYNSNGSLDTTFDGDGKVISSIGSSYDSSSAIGLQTDGKVLAVGSSSNTLNEDFVVVRYNINGSLDTTFYNNGKITTDFGLGNGFGHGYAVALQSDGKIVVAGINSDGNYNVNFALARYNIDGSLDVTFGTDGKVTTDFGIRFSDIGYTNRANAVAIQPDGKILVAGSSGNGGSDSQFAVARYNNNGSLDATFGIDGKVKTNFTGQGWAVAVQTDGKIIVAGDTGYPNITTCCSSIALVRYNANGSLDSTFDGDGMVFTDFNGNSLASGQSIVIQPNGKILVGGGDYHGSYSEFGLVRYNTNGSLDTTFDGDGRTTTTFEGSDYATSRDIVLQPDEKIVLVGYGLNATGTFSDIVLARYNTDGSLDTTFDTDGKVITDFGSSYEGGWAAALRPDGMLVVAGYSNGNFVLGRYKSDGSLDATFDTDGKVISNIGIGSGNSGDIVLQADGKIVVAGGAWNDESYSWDFALARFIGDQLPTFADVPWSYWSNSYIDRLYFAGITGGCSTTPLLYCPEAPVTRAQMAVFLLRGIHGSSYSPPAVGVSTGFNDVPIDYWSASWIKQLAVEGITGGCGVGLYCPETIVTRAQMAVFLLRAKYTSAHTPPIATGTFADVPADYWSAGWIEQLAVEGITGGCGVGVYCPESNVTRAQMAVFLVRTFGLP